jgi:hypothetical protein
MVTSAAATVPDYLAELPAERRQVIAAVRTIVLANLDHGYQEAMQYGMISYIVPLSAYPPGADGNGKQPLPFASLAAQKAHYALYLMGIYCGCGEDGRSETPDARWFRCAWERTGKRMDMGKSCVRFARLEDVPLEVVGEAIARVPAARYVEFYRATVAQRKQKR